MEQDNWTLSRIEKGLGPPYPPEPMIILYRMEAYHTTYMGGGLYGEPHILMMEIDQVIRAQNEMKSIAVANAVNAANSHTS